MAYGSKKQCLDHFKGAPDAYKKFGPLAQDMVALYDQIRLHLPRLYNDSGGKFGRLTGVTKYSGRRTHDPLLH